MKKLDEPTFNFNLDTLTYSEITKIFMKMKSSTSLCVSDAINIIVFNEYPILRLHLVKTMQTAWIVKMVL